jgi:hypothetical protein
MEFSDSDIQVLLKVTLLTPTSKKIRVVIPFIKKFCPQVELFPNVPTYLPLFHTLQLEALGDSTEGATIDLSPLIPNPNHEHYINVQTYSSTEPSKPGSRYAFHLEFAQVVVRANETNYMEVSFGKIALKVSDPKIRQMSLNLRVVVSHGSGWNGKQLLGNDLIKYDESTTLMYHSLLDSVILQLFSEKVKLCETRRFVFELLGDGSRIFDLEGEVIKRASIKVACRPSLPVVLVE